MKILFLNIWDCRTDKIAIDFINEYSKKVDIICLQEAHEKTQALLHNALIAFQPYTHHKFIHAKDFYTQITYIRNNLEVIQTSKLLLDIKNSGLALHTSVVHKNTILNICNVHGTPYPGDKLDTPTRLQQSQNLISFYKNLEGIKIIGGDFNLNIKTQSINIFEQKGYINLIKANGIQHTRNKLAWDLHPDNKQDYADYVFVNTKTKISSFVVIENEISDHLPMILTLNI